MGWKTLRETVLKGTRGAVVLSAADAKRLLAKYFELFPEVQDYQRRTEQLVKEHKSVFNLFGHRAQFIGRFSGALARTVISWAPQSTVGQCTNIAAGRFQDYIDEQRLPWNLLPPVHDSILVEVPTADVEHAMYKLRLCMSFTFKSPIDGWEASIGVEVQVVDNWGKYDETENPNGMRVV
jgi:DNA polymerase I-like protein with 3'-5' exonuclease and polymerase domains